MHSSDITHLKEKKLIESQGFMKKSHIVETENGREDRIGSQKISQSRKLYGDNAKLAASEVVDKRDIVKELEERRRKLQ